MEDQDFYGLPIVIESEDGCKYAIEPYEATIDSVEFLWQRAGQYSFLFSDMTYGDKERFKLGLLSPGTIILSITQLGDEHPQRVGIVFADKLVPKWDARVHYLFWDRKQAGRHKVLLTALRWFMDQFSLHRVTAEVMQYAYAALRRAKLLGFKLEGRKREGTTYRGKRADVLLFGILRYELTKAAIEQGKMLRTTEEDSWYGLLDDNYALSRAMLKER